jgi:autotransporter-associated beta strand protein/probable HAF family extracellular repeat protein
MSEFLYGLDPYGNIVVTDTANGSVVFEGIGDSSSTATGVSGDGFTVVGYDAAGRTEAFSWTASTGMVGLGYLPYGLVSQAFGTNSDGSVTVGMSYYGSPSVTDYAYQAFRSVDGTMTRLGFLAPGTGGGESVANAVSGDGTVVVGWTENGDHYEAFRWTATTGMAGLGYLPSGYRTIATGTNADGSVVVGWGDHNFSGSEAFRWTASTGIVGLGYLPGGSYSRASAVSADGTVVVGNATDAGGNSDAVSWSSGTIAVLGTFAPSAVNADGSVIVGTGTGAVRWTAATGTQSIQNILTADGVNLSGWELDSATGVSADGTVIVGNGNQPWIATIPVNAFALLDLKGIDHSIGSLVWGGTVTNSGSNAATLTEGSDHTSTTFIGVIQDGTSTTALAKVGTGTLTLTGVSTYTGGTMLHSGTLDLAALGAAARDRSPSRPANKSYRSRTQRFPPVHSAIPSIALAEAM